MSVKTQQQQIDMLLARVEALEARENGWQSVSSASQILGVSPTFLRERCKLRRYQKAHRRSGRLIQIHVGLFRKQLDQEQKNAYQK